jgi:hypothetical protein
LPDPSIYLTLLPPAPTSPTASGGGSAYELTSMSLGVAGLAQTAAEFGSGNATIGNNLKIYWNGWGGGSRASICTTRIGELAHGGGFLLFGASVIEDANGALNGDITWDKFGVNSGFGSLGLLGGPAGAGVAGTYSAIDNFYPGGWPGYATDGGIALQTNMHAAPYTWSWSYPIIGP